MCTCCSVTAKKSWVFGCGSGILLLSLIVGLLWPTLSMQVLYSQLVLKNGSLSYENWIKTPIPMYMEFTMFNWTNSDQVHDPSVKPMFTEMGPYVFLESRERNDLAWHDDNETISFNQTRTWHFQADRSNGSLDDLLTNLNVISVTVAYSARDFTNSIKIGLNFIMNSRGGSLFVTKPVRQWLFDGFDDPLLDFLKEAELPYDLPFDRFGWFYSRNESSSYDGRINMYTGQDKIAKLGTINTWNNISHTPFYRDKCGMINGTTGEIWQPGMHPTAPITMFPTDICRSITLNYAGTIEHLGIEGSQWVADESVFDNGLLYPQQACFCTAAPESCPDLAPGVFNVSECRYGAPAFISYPHFYLADPSYRDAIDGMAPQSDLHKFTIALEPTTGIPLAVNARMQVNILLQPIELLSIFENIPKVMVPMLWFTQTAELDEEFANQAKLAIMLPGIGVYTAYGFAVFGIILLLVGGILTAKKSWNGYTQYHNDDELRL